MFSALSVAQRREAAMRRCSFALLTLLESGAIALSAGASASAARSHFRLSSISCTSPSFCVAVGGGEAVVFRDGRWGAPRVIGRSGDIASVTCVSSSFCAVTENGFESPSKALIYDGRAWGKPQQVFPTDSSYSGQTISCVSSRFCVAVGGEKAATFNGASWSKARAIDHSQVVQAISCHSATFCAASDTSGNALTFKDGKWTAPKLVDRSSHGLTSVACPSSSQCLAVDYNGNEVTYDGRSWGPQTPVAVNPGFDSLSCSTPRFCMAVGDAGVALSYNGSTWGKAKSIDSGVQSVSCPTTRFCAAVDVGDNVMTFNGRSWSRPKTIH